MADLAPSSLMVDLKLYSILSLMASPTSTISASPSPVPSPCEGAGNTLYWPSANGCAAIFENPDQLTEEARNKMQNCCNGANVTSIADDCGLFCPIKYDLTEEMLACMGIPENDVGQLRFCQYQTTEITTLTSSSTSSSTTASTSSSSSPPSSSPSSEANRVTIVGENNVFKGGVGMLVLIAGLLSLGSFRWLGFPGVLGVSNLN